MCTFFGFVQGCSTVKCQLPKLLPLHVPGEPEQKSTSEAPAVVEESWDAAEASAPLLESPQPALAEEEARSEDGEQAEKASSDSVGSGSSFEELDLEIEEEKKSEAVEEEHNGQQKPVVMGETMGNREE